MNSKLAEFILLRKMLIPLVENKTTPQFKAQFEVSFEYWPGDGLSG